MQSKIKRERSRSVRRSFRGCCMLPFVSRIPHTANHFLSLFAALFISPSLLFVKTTFPWLQLSLQPQMNSKSLSAFLSPFDGANAASAAGVPGCGVSPPYMFLYVTPLSVPLYVIYYYIAWRAFLFGLRMRYIACGTKASARRTNHLIFHSFCGRSRHELDTQKSTFVSCSSG